MVILIKKAKDDYYAKMCKIESPNLYIPYNGKKHKRGAVV